MTNVAKAHQRIIREEIASNPPLSLFPDRPDVIDIKKAIIKEISFETAKKIILRYEWLGTMGTTQLHYGIYFNGHCAGVACYGYFQAMNRNGYNHPYEPYVGASYAEKGIQLSRGACVHWAHPHSASFLISGSLKRVKKLGYKYAIAFSDPEAGEIGTVYQATNWHYLGFGVRVHYDLYYKDGRLFMNNRDIAKKLRMAGKKVIEEYISDKPDLVIKKIKPKARYIYLLGNRRENKEMMSVLRDKIKPYIKR